MTQREINDKKWKDHWENMNAYIKERLEGCLYILDEHSMGIIKNRRSYQVYGAEESFKFDNNTKLFIKAENKRTGKFVKVYEYRIAEQELRRCSQSHIVYNAYNKKEIKFLQELRDAVVDYYRPNSIKFITDNF